MCKTNILGKDCRKRYDSCKVCKHKDHRLLEKNGIEVLPQPIQKMFQGDKDCFHKTEITEYYYYDDNQFHKCLPKCKRCKNNIHCDECEEGAVFKENLKRCEDPCPNPNELLGADLKTCSESCKEGEYKVLDKKYCKFCSTINCSDCAESP